jgi:hypothetical protein
MTDMQSAAPCYVLGIETQIGLSLIRELGEAGIPVIGIATDANAIGLQSRYLAHGEILRKPRTDEGLAELRSFGERHGRGYLLTVSEANTSWLIDNRAHLGLITPCCHQRMPSPSSSTRPAPWRPPRLSALMCPEAPARPTGRRLRRWPGTSAFLRCSSGRTPTPSRLPWVRRASIW